MGLCKAAKVHEPQIKQTNICAMKTIFFKTCIFAQLFCTQKGESVESKAVGKGLGVGLVRCNIIALE